MQEGDYVTMCSATFGDEMWSTRGVGLNRVLNAIRVRSGPTVKLVFENPTEPKRKVSVTEKQVKAQEDAWLPKPNVINSSNGTKNVSTPRGSFGLF